MKLAALLSLVMFTGLAQAKVCTTSENLICGMAPICSSEYTVTCSDGTSKSFSGITGPLGWGKGAYPQVIKWTQAQGLTEKKVGKKITFFYDNSERSDSRYCVTELINSEKTGIDGKAELHNIYVSCPYDSAKSKLLKLVTKEDVEADLLSKGYKSISSDKATKTQYYRHAND